MTDAGLHGQVAFITGAGSGLGPTTVASLGVRVNAVCPGYVDTPLLAPFNELLRASITMRIANGRMARAEELAEFVRFLARPQSSYCTGEVFTASGGYS